MHDSGLVDRVYDPAVVRIAAQLSDAQSTIIVTTPEAGVVITSTKPTPTNADPPDPEPGALKPTKQQAHRARILRLLSMRFLPLRDTTFRYLE
jgi:hypothetical protein